VQAAEKFTRELHLIRQKIHFQISSSAPTYFTASDF